MYPKNLEARIDVLSDGSDHAGGAAVFLTIRRCGINSSSHILPCPDDRDSSSEDGHDDLYYEEDVVDDGTIVARYNLSGIPSLTSRLSSDQSFKLMQNGAFRAVLVPSMVESFDGERIRGECIGGFPALFLNLIHAGYKVACSGGDNGDNNHKHSIHENSSDSGVEDCEASTYHTDNSYNDVSIVGPAGLNDAVDGLLDTMFGNLRKRPSLRLCEVPHSNEQWYEVYTDKYVCIWSHSIPYHDTTAHCCRACSSDRNESNAARNDYFEECLVFIVMLRSFHIGLNKKDYQHGSKRQRTSSPINLSGPYSFAIMTQPSTFCCSRGTTCQKCGTSIAWDLCSWDVFRHLPQDIIPDRKQSPFALDFILHLNALAGEKVYENTPRNGAERIDAKRVERRQIIVPSWVIDAKLTGQHFALFRDTSGNEDTENGILIRARHRSKVLHEALPFAFPLKITETMHQNYQILDRNGEHVGGCLTSTSALKLQSCTSVILSSWGSTQRNSFAFISRANAIKSRCQDIKFASWNEISQIDKGLSPQCTMDYMEMFDSLKCAFSGRACYCKRCDDIQQGKTVDDNEIDLDDSSCDCEDREHLTKDGGASVRDTSISTIDVNSAHLLFLGTGCATPSPHRGSSGIGLFMPISIYRSEKSSFNKELVLSALIECGEGTLNSISWHIKSFSCQPTSLEDQLSHVNFIWISHAHLDHYGDLSCVVQAVAKAKRKVHKTQPVVVIAPAKVLAYLRVMLKSHIMAGDRQFIGVTHRDFQTSPFLGHVRSMIYDYKIARPSYSFDSQDSQATNYYKPFVSIQNVEVEHCSDAFALMIQMCIPMNNDAFNRFVLCFSGDTRPSAMLTKACLRSPFPISLLIHEATFIDDSQGREDALRKRHSTVKEAFDVATDIKAEACMLTHFSQRYCHVSARDASANESNSYTGSWGIACDGMLIPLTKRGMNSLFPLTKCIDAILSPPS